MKMLKHYELINNWKDTEQRITKVTIFLEKEGPKKKNKEKKRRLKIVFLSTIKLERMNMYKLCAKQTIMKPSNPHDSHISSKVIRNKPEILQGYSI